MGYFHPNNNPGLEIFAIGVISLFIFAMLFLLWVIITNWRYKPEQNN